MSIEITNLRKVNQGKLRAFFSVTWPDKMTVNDMKLMEGNDGQLWAATPSREYVNKDGEKKWAPVVKIIDTALAQRISEAARQAYFGEVKPESNEDIPF